MYKRQAGAFPPVIGWTIATGSLSIEPLTFFLIIFFWTPSHFWALSLYKSDDYKKAKIPMLPITAGIESTKFNILLYALLMLPVAAAPFFVGFGSKGLIGLLICGFLMIYTCFSLLKAGKQNDLRTNEDAFRHFCGRYLGIFMTWYTMIMIVAVYGVMLGGVGATLEQAYGLPVIFGSGLMAFCATITLLLGLNKIIEVLGVIGPIIVILTLATAVSTILDDSLSLKEGILLSDGLEILRASENWFFSAILYAVFSLPGLYGFLPLVGATIKSNFEVKGVALLGPFLFISAMTIVVLALIGCLLYTSPSPRD